MAYELKEINQAVEAVMDDVGKALKESMDRNGMWSALEKPKWTHVPPTKPGWYWIRAEGKFWIIELVEGLGSLWITKNGNPYLPLEKCPGDREWWPIPIQVPEEEE